jgi:glycosyltransferase involved in cell wall biosynthesis
LDHLLGLWPEIRAAVPGARLLLAGRHFPQDAVGILAGVEFVGTVRDSREVLERTAIVPFLCPNSTGPKGKVLEALAHAIPVVTTSAGFEGLEVGADLLRSLTTSPAQFATRLAALLRDPEERARLGKLGREAVAVRHSPRAAAQARIDAFSEAFDL